MEFLDDEVSLVIKTTIPHRIDDAGSGFSAFGLTPILFRRSLPDFRGGTLITRASIEFVPATPLEYLDRWVAVNDIFKDQVELRSVVVWKCQHISFVIAQPYYNGEPARDAEIVEFFLAERWIRIPDPTREHLLFYNYAFDVLAIDAAARNCYHAEGYLMPFDVILCRPNAEMAEFLQLYPD